MTKAFRLLFHLCLILCVFGQVDRSIFEHLISNRPIEYLNEQQIRDTLLGWQLQFPELVRVSTTQDAFGLSRAGGSEDCLHEEHVEGCSNFFFVMQDFVTHPEGSVSSNELPELFWSGAMHGSDLLGPTVVIKAASLMLQAAQCESLPNANSNSLRSWEEELAAAQDCRVSLYAQGVDDKRRQWLARLVSTRRIVVLPTPNALGFSRGEKFEGSVDPDQDFPYAKNEDSTSCMQSIAAKSVNEIFREHMFQVSVSFHMGDDVIGFPWGSEFWGADVKSPDIAAQMALASAKEYGRLSADDVSVGQLSKIIQTRRMGAPEDWAYASSWDTKRVASCAPEIGYNSSKTKYDESTNRAIALMVSGAIRNATDLGKSNDFFQEIFKDNDPTLPLPRNVRMAFASADLVQPYVSVLAIGNAVLSDDVIPRSDQAAYLCRTTKAVIAPASRYNLKIEWTAGGGFNFSEVSFWHANWADFERDEVSCVSQPGFDVARDPRFKKGTLLSDPDVDAGVGSGMFSSSGPHPAPRHSLTGDNRALGPVFRGIFDLDDYTLGDEIMVLASIRSDQAWKVPPIQFSYGPNVGPQSHLINARTDPNWEHKLSEKSIKGRLDWYSTPATIVLADYDSRLGEIELYNRYERKRVDIDSLESSNKRKRLLMMVSGVILSAATILLVWRHCLRKRQEPEKLWMIGDYAEENVNNCDAFAQPAFRAPPTKTDDNSGAQMDQFEDLQAFSRPSNQEISPTRIEFEDDEDSMIIFSNGVDDNDDKILRGIGFLA